MTLRILFTLAMLVGRAAAPAAQTFRWEPNNGRSDVSNRVERALEQARRQVDRRWQRVEQQWERHINRATRSAVRAGGAYNFRWNDRSSNYIERQPGTDADPCANTRDSDDENRQHCEVRESTMPAGPLTVDAGDNGGITVDAWDRHDIRVRAVVRGWARTDERAREIANNVQVQSGGGRVSATGPDGARREGWSVSYRINVPLKTDLDLNAHNGGITITGVNGNVRFDTTNGGVRLTDLAGHVNGSTRNGGLTVNLSGSRWDGEGLDVETSNGGVTVAVPDGYNAQLETRTVNGGFRSDIPLTIQGELTSNRGISTTLGSGGPMVRVRTTNGGLKIGRR